MKNPKNVVIKKGCHSRKSVSGIYNARCCQIKDDSLLNRYVEDPRVLRTAKSGMTASLMSGSHPTYKIRSGFTLIELLVVVLIIGILAAVAVPQYNKAVLKARTVELINVLNAGQKAIDAWVLENGYKDATWEDFVLEIPMSDKFKESYRDMGSGCDEMGGECMIAFESVDANPSTALADIAFVKKKAGWSRSCSIYGNNGVSVCQQLKQSFPDMSIVDRR